jgi:5'-3' exonuclease
LAGLFSGDRKIIIFDYRHTAIRNLMALQRELKTIEVEEGLLRHMILNSIRAVNSRHRRQYGKIVLACEGGQLWRREAFPYYKAARKKGRDQSLIDWKAVDQILEMIAVEIGVYLGYPVVSVPGAEGDDVIAALVKDEAGAGDCYLASPDEEPTMIVSSDRDFSQLLVNPAVRLWDPIQQKDVVSNDPERDLKEKIIRGDPGDGVPNVLSADDVFVTGTRQKSIFEKKLAEWLDQEPREFCELSKWERNQRLIDFNCIPGRGDGRRAG